MQKATALIILFSGREILFSATRQCSYQNKYGEMTDRPQRVEVPCTLHLHTSGEVLQTVEKLR